VDPRSSNTIPEPATRSLTVPETSTSPGAARVAISKRAIERRIVLVAKAIARQIGLPLEEALQPVLVLEALVFRCQKRYYMGFCGCKGRRHGAGWGASASRQPTTRSVFAMRCSNRRCRHAGWGVAHRAVPTCR
jgi:hypothetical protein